MLCSAFHVTSTFSDRETSFCLTQYLSAESPDVCFGTARVHNRVYRESRSNV